MCALVVTLNLILSLQLVSMQANFSSVLTAEYSCNIVKKFVRFTLEYDIMTMPHPYNVASRNADTQPPSDEEQRIHAEHLAAIQAVRMFQNRMQTRQSKYNVATYVYYS